jgi:hypothetical protein
MSFGTSRLEAILRPPIGVDTGDGPLTRSSARRAVGRRSGAGAAASESELGGLPGADAAVPSIDNRSGHIQTQDPGLSYRDVRRAQDRRSRSLTLRDPQSTPGRVGRVDAGGEAAGATASPAAAVAAAQNPWNLASLALFSPQLAQIRP